MSKPKKRKKHLIKRIKERVGGICQSDLEDNLDHSKIMFAKKISNSRSLGYIIIENKPIKIVYSKTCKKIITVLNIYNDYEFPIDGYIEFHSYENTGESYRLKIFPDCYLETDNPKALTIFEIWNEEKQEWITKKKTSNKFIKLFTVVWGTYEQTKKILS